MLELSAFVVELEAGLPGGWADSDFALRVTEVELQLPVEVRFVGAGVELSTPRGRLETGFAVEHGRVRLSFALADLPVAHLEQGGAP